MTRRTRFTCCRRSRSWTAARSSPVSVGRWPHTPHCPPNLPQKFREKGPAVTMHDLIRAVARRLGQKQRPVEEAVHMAFTEITEALMQGDRVNLSSFGTFRVKT